MMHLRREDKYRQNWSENIQYSSRQVLVPGTVHEVQTIVKKHPQIKVIGTRHCFNRIADTPATHISLENLKQVHFETQHDGTTLVRFGAGLTYSQLIRAVDEKGDLAIANLPSLPHINVVGSMITATHGSGHNYPILAHWVTSMDIVLADGTLKTID